MCGNGAAAAAEVAQLRLSGEARERPLGKRRLGAKCDGEAEAERRQREEDAPQLVAPLELDTAEALIEER